MIPITEDNQHIFKDLFYDPELEELFHEGVRIPWINDEPVYNSIIDFEGVECRVYKEDIEMIAFVFIAENLHEQY
jgi:hypothetical protein